MSTKYMAAVAPNKRKVLLVANSGDSNTYTNYDGEATVWYEPYDDKLTDDSNSPQINEEYHMALVWGALQLAGFDQYARRFDTEVRAARTHKTGKPFHVTRPVHY